MYWAETIKQAIQALRNAGQDELAHQLVELQEDALAIREKNLDLTARNQELEGQLRLQQEVRYEGRSYWRVSDGGKDGPFCQLCFDRDRKLIRLHPITMERPNDSLMCLACQTTYDR